MQLSHLSKWIARWCWHNHSALPWNRLRIHAELAKREAFARWPLHGNVLELFKQQRVSIGSGTLFEPGVWLTAAEDGRITIGRNCFFNLGVQVASFDHVEIGDYCMFANGCFITDANHRFDDPEQPVPYQGFTTKGRTTIGDNVWCGVNVVVLSGVTIGDRAVIGANSVVASDIPARSIAVGSPAKVVKMIEYSSEGRAS